MRVVVLLLAIVLAGCFSAQTRSGESPAETRTATPYPTDCQPYGTGSQDCTDIILAVFSNHTGSVQLGIPYPHGSWCLTGEQWIAGIRTPQEANGQLFASDRGQVIALTGPGPLNWHSRIITSHLNTCQTFRYDPWSTEPDLAEDEGLDIYVWEGQLTSLEVVTRSGGCWHTSQYIANGTMAEGWNRLVHNPRPMVCA